VLAAFLVFGNWIAGAALRAGRHPDRRCVPDVRLAQLQLLRQRSTVLDFCVIASVVNRGGRLTTSSRPRRGAGLGDHSFHPRTNSRAPSSGASDRRPVSSKTAPPAGEQASWSSTAPDDDLRTARQPVLRHHDQLFTELEPDLKRCRYLILDMRRVQSVDFTAAHLLELSSDPQGTRRFSPLQPAAREFADGAGSPSLLRAVGVMKEKENVRIFRDTRRRPPVVEDRILAAERAGPEGGEASLTLAQIETVPWIRG